MSESRDFEKALEQWGYCVKSFRDKLRDASEANRSLLCVGLDPDRDLMAVPDVFVFNKAVIDATKDLVCAYKPNIAFYEALGWPGMEDLERTLGYIRQVAPGVPVIIDAKRGDVASTSKFYASALFDSWGFDAATVNAYGGGDSLEPFTKRADRGVFVWCRSSNPGAEEFQDLSLSSGDGDDALYRWVARRAAEWDTAGNIGLVVGATYPDQLGTVRSLCPDMPLLVPGVGAQGGDLAESVRQGVDANGRGILIGASRSVTYASKSATEFADASREAAGSLRDDINRVLEEEGKGW